MNAYLWTQTLHAWFELCLVFHFNWPDNLGGMGHSQRSLQNQKGMHMEGDLDIMYCGGNILLIPILGCNDCMSHSMY